MGKRGGRAIDGGKKRFPRFATLKNDGIAILMATHDLFRACEIADQVGMMRSGCLIETL